MDVSADVAAWTAVGVAALSVIVSLALYRSGQRSAAIERVRAHDIDALTRMLEIMSGPSSVRTDVVMPIEYMDSLIDTLSSPVRNTLEAFRDDLATKDQTLLMKRGDDIRMELQVAIAEVVNHKH